jgi:hypothetical protein
MAGTFMDDRGAHLKRPSGSQGGGQGSIIQII